MGQVFLSASDLNDEGNNLPGHGNLGTLRSVEERRDDILG